MKHILRSLLFCLVLISITAFDLLAQISIDYPANRIVFQRDQNNSATVYIAGSYSQVIDRVEAKLTALNGGTSTNWTTIQSGAQGGLFSGSIDAKGGWYQLDVRGWNGTQLVGTAQLEKVGIGEVFMISGQSNGEGLQNLGAVSASDDRVNCIDANNSSSSNTDLSNPVFSHLNADSNISPRGNSAWSWGKLGDLLASRLGVPILFYNSAFTGTAVKNWRESTNGTAYSIYNGEPYPNGLPYSNLRAVMQHYVPITGIRAVLWLQGEAEVVQSTTTQAYFDDLRKVIETSRSESGKNLSWMVSLTSYANNQQGVYPNAIAGQKQVIASVPNVYTGPNTDVIQIPRDGGTSGVHFTNNGLTELAQAWNTQLTDDFFSTSTPFKAVSPLNVTASCTGSNNLNLAANTSGYSSIRWSNGQTSASVQVGTGTYSAQARDASGNIIASPQIKITGTIQYSQPVITLEGSNPVCQGNTAVLISNVSENLRWNTGATSDRINITTAGEYYATATSNYGCVSTSAKVSVNVLTSPLPDKPTISASGAVTFCDGGSVSLKSSSTVKSLWSNGLTDATISVKTSGEYRVRAQDSFGCFSPDSDPVTVKVNALPSKPQVSYSRSPIFCEGENVTLTSNYDSGNIWNTSATSKSISVSTSGTFSVKQRDSNGCENTSDVITTKVNPLPGKPTIEALRATTFCERDYTTLRGSASYAYQWSNGGTNRDVEIRTAGNYTLAVKDENGCVSPSSDRVQVVVNPLPAQPVISANGPTTFCDENSVDLSSNDARQYLWNNGASTKTIKIFSSGDYFVKTINEYSCYSDPSSTVKVQVLALPPSPTVQASGPTSFCDGDEVTLKASNGTTFFWNTGEETSSLVVTTSGDYAARVLDRQGCYSKYSTAVTVDVKALPSQPTIKQIGTYTLIADNNINDGDHVWQLDGTDLSENGTTLKAVKTGAYVVNNTVIYSPTLTCFSPFSEPFLFTLDTGNGDISVYPNPSDDGNFAVETLEDLQDATIRVYDLNGRLLRMFTSQNFSERRFVNLSPLPNGMYILLVQSGGYKKSKKIVINR